MVQKWVSPKKRCLCYIESDFSYYYLVLKCFGPLIAFLRLWIAILVIFPVQQTIMAWVFGQYIIYPFFGGCQSSELASKLASGCAIAFLTWVNCHSTNLGTYMNNVFTASKIAALGLLIALGFKNLAMGEYASLASDKLWEGTSMDVGKYAAACLSGLFSYQGWSFLNYVVEELQEPRKNLPRAIFISIATTTTVYLLTNMAYFAVLGKGEMINSQAVAIVRWFLIIFFCFF